MGLRTTLMLEKFWEPVWDTVKWRVGATFQFGRTIFLAAMPAIRAKWFPMMIPRVYFQDGDSVISQTEPDTRGFGDFSEADNSSCLKQYTFSNVALGVCLLETHPSFGGTQSTKMACCCCCCCCCENRPWVALSLKRFPPSHLFQSKIRAGGENLKEGRSGDWPGATLNEWAEDGWSGKHSSGWTHPLRGILQEESGFEKMPRTFVNGSCVASPVCAF